jgi:UDP-glucose:(heptosyl)LPS alpha-1,3-glucosyltransferase
VSEHSLDIAIAVFRLAPAGGRERDALRVAAALAARGHRIIILTTRAGKPPDGVDVRVLPRRGLTNHGRLKAFAADVASAVRGRLDLVVGFQKMPGLDVLYCCDWCHADRKLRWFARRLPRHRAMLALEEACFGPASETELLMLAEPQAQAYRAAFAGSGARMTVLPPTLDAARIHQPPDAGQRAAWRDQLGIVEDRTTWLWLGLQPRVKGLDRAVRALALSPDAVLLACGMDPGHRHAKAAAALARELGCAERVTFTGRAEGERLMRLFLSADLLMHPSRLDVTGTVIVEALAAGLPAIVTDNCGYAPHVAAAHAGVVVPRDATPAQLAQAASPDPTTLSVWSAAARAYVRSVDLTGGITEAADIIERLAARKK